MTGTNILTSLHACLAQELKNGCVILNTSNNRRVPQIMRLAVQVLVKAALLYFTAEAKSPACIQRTEKNVNNLK